MSGFRIDSSSRNEAAADDFADCDGLSSRTGASCANAYRLAGFLAAGFGARTIVDLGCASVPDLMAIEGFQKVGIEPDSNIEEHRQGFPQGGWVGTDLERIGEAVALDDVVSGSVVICADLVQRLFDPSSFFEHLARHAGRALAIIVTTPEREVADAGNEQGERARFAGQRGWTLGEFREFLGRIGMVPTFLGSTASDSGCSTRKTIVAVFDGCPLGEDRARNLDIHPLAIVSTYNDADIAVQTIFKLLEDGIHVRVLDNWSTDGTHEQLSVLAAIRPDLQIERFPVSGPTENYEFDAILRRKEEIACQFPGRWIIHHDSDEIRCSPWAGISLRGGLQVVERMNFTAVDFTVCDFRPTDGRFSAGIDPEQQIRHFEFGTRPDLFNQVKAWRQGEDRVDLASHAGHNVLFPGRRVFPYKFILKHYPMRSPAQAWRKVFLERRGRFSPRLRARGWHIHYDSVRTDDPFIWKAADLIEFDEHTTRTTYLTELIAGIGIAR